MLISQWVFGGIDTQTQEGYLIAVENRDAATLLPTLQQYILPEAIVIFDLWGAYNTVSVMGYQHLTVNHLLRFVDLVTYATTNHVESKWSRAKKETNANAEYIARFCQTI